MKKEIERGEIIPKYYGFAWEDYMRNVYICYLFPLNHIIGVLRRIWIKIRHHPFDDTDYLKITIEQLREKIEKREKIIEEYRKADASFLGKINKELTK